MTSFPAGLDGCAHGPSALLYGGLLERCVACGVVATAAAPRFDYAASYFTEPGEGGYDFDSGFARAFDEARFRAELERLERDGLGGSVLDVGCATGTFLALARSRGWEVAGVEVSAFARERASVRIGVPVAPSLAALGSGRRFDVVTLHHVLEHVPDPVGLLRDGVAPLVGRRLLVEVPNFAALASRVEGRAWRDLRPEQHVYHFTPQTLPRLVRSSGLVPQKTYTLWPPLWSLRSAFELARLLARAPLGAGRDGAASGPAPAATEYRPPRGVRSAANEASRLLLRPLVLALEAAGLGERLVVEAVPGGDA